MPGEQKKDQFEYGYFLCLLGEHQAGYIPRDESLQGGVLDPEPLFEEKFEFDHSYPIRKAFYPKRPVFLPPPDFHYTNILDALIIQQDVPAAADGEPGMENSGRAVCPAEPTGFQ